MKDQVYVCPAHGGRSTVPGNLPPGVNPEAVQAAGDLDSALKQVRKSTVLKYLDVTFISGYLF